jgi:peptidoglycan hydrolase CwlO-like protein
VRFVRFPALSLRSLLTSFGVLLAIGLVSLPAMSAAQRGGGDPSSEREAVRAKQAQLASQVDALKATDAEVEAALDALQANVSGQEALLAEAQRAATEAEEAFAQATAAVEAKTAEIEVLRDEIREFAVQAFVHPPADDALAALDTSDPGEAAEKRALLEIQNTNDADLLDRLTAAEEDLEVERGLAEEASQRAQEKRAAAADRLGELTNARDQQAAYANQVQTRLDHALGEVAALAELDASLSRKIQAEQAALARKAAAATPRRSSGGGRSSVTFNGSLSSVSCPSGGSITVASSIASNLQSLLNAASSDGVPMCGGGYRSSQGQIDTRRANCGSSYYDIYEKPASQCSPPTARPGQSMHEQGLAVDFTYNGRAISSRSSPAFQWMSRNAGSYGFYNLPSEPWHWSSNGN